MVKYPYKLFKSDKNYLLKEAQITSRDLLLKNMVDTVKHYYLTYHNPLSLVDSAVQKIMNSNTYNLPYFEYFYNYLAGLYRYQNPDNQLEMIFDGRSHLEIYREQWEQAFQQWLKKFLIHENFIKAVLEATVFCGEGSRQVLFENRMKHFLVSYFEIKLNKYKGFLQTKAA